MTLDNQIDTTTGTVKLKGLFENEDEALFPNQFVNARLLVNTKHDVVLLSNLAIQRNADGAFVYVVKPDLTVTMKTITLGTTNGTETEVVGIEPTDVIAGDNFSRLTEGAKVAVRPASGAPKKDQKPAKS